MRCKIIIIHDGNTMPIMRKQCSLDFHRGQHPPLPLSIPLSSWIKNKTRAGGGGRVPVGRRSSPSPWPRSWPRALWAHASPVREDIGSFFALTTGSLRQGISHSCSSIIWKAFKERNVPQRGVFNNAPALSALGCAAKCAPLKSEQSCSSGLPLSMALTMRPPALEKQPLIWGSDTNGPYLAHFQQDIAVWIQVLPRPSV